MEQTIEKVFMDFKGRRAGLIKALTTDSKDLYDQCDPNKENLCLYGLPSEDWEVTLPVEEVPAEIPEPALGINFSRKSDGQHDVEKWLGLIAEHSDAWLVSVAFYFATRFRFGKSDRDRLFGMINELPTLCEILKMKKKTQKKERSSTSKTNSKSKTRAQELKDDGIEDEEDNEILCGACGKNSGSDEFWIGCDVCEKWFHGKCVKISAAKAKHIEIYKCPSCNGNGSNEKSRRA